MATRRPQLLVGVSIVFFLHAAIEISLHQFTRRVANRLISRRAFAIVSDLFAGSTRRSGGSRLQGNWSDPAGGLHSRAGASRCMSTKHNKKSRIGPEISGIRTQSILILFRIAPLLRMQRLIWTAATQRKGPIDSASDAGASLASGLEVCRLCSSRIARLRNSQCESRKGAEPKKFQPEIRVQLGSARV